MDPSHRVRTIAYRPRPHSYAHRGTVGALTDFDAIVVGGGHTGLTWPPTWRPCLVHEHGAVAVDALAVAPAAVA